METADFYGRKSNNDAGQSVAGQETEFRDDCEDQGYRVGRIFADPDRSASRYARRPRPDYTQLVEHIRSGNCQILSLWESSRGSRKLGEWVDFLDLCRQHGTLIRIISHQRTYDMKIRRDWRTLADDGVDSADESEKISERTRRGKRKAAREGRPTGRLPFGWTRVYDERGKLADQVPHPEQAPIVREIITDIANGKPAGQIAASLNERGIPTPQKPCKPDCDRDHRHFPPDMKWTDRQVRQLAIRPHYAGRRVHQGQDVGAGKWKPLVDPKVWQTAYNRLTANSGMRNDPRVAHWLTGAVKCSECMHGLRSGSRKPGHNAYQCRNCFAVSASARGLEGVIEPLIRARLRQPDAAAVFEPDDDSTELEQAKMEEKALRAHLDGFYKLASKPGAGITPEGLAAIEQETLPQIKAAAAKVRRLSTPPALSRFAGVDVDAEWDDLDARARREVVCALADIVLTPGSKGSGPKFDPSRLGRSRWVGDNLTWAERWGGLTSPAP
ncbi:recombinase family protein [Micromonospora sp. NPDC049891]|uniref:recombinase family protein n=1 Tax=Micromonospora sp. NPDC049891 TaxID=3155655 RepID=UPI00340A161C